MKERINSGVTMKQIDRTKACWNCEADVNYEATYCPFCGTDLLTSSAEAANQAPKHDAKFSDQTLQESLASLYKPPYSVRNRQGLGVPDERVDTPFKQADPIKDDPLFQSYDEVEHQESEETVIEEEEVTRRGDILPLLFLMIGAHFFVLGTLLLFCSKDGFVTLQWNSSYWFIYCLISFPILYLGARLLKRTPAP
ncbi:MAG: hypothetical protein K1060chlam2_00143 [Chlamydiae bacterium]|nr:hypothetical protein [Chlamydiota bacterium]